MQLIISQAFTGSLISFVPVKMGTTIKRRINSMKKTSIDINHFILVLLDIQCAELSGRSGVEPAVFEEAGEHASDT